jgi:hypothetical protein
MNKTFQAAVVAAAVLAAPALSLAAQTKPAAQTAPAAAKSKTEAKPNSGAKTVYSVSGVVKSIDTSTLVLTEKSGKKKRSRDVHFVLDPSVQKDANIAAGSTVRVKYHNDAK